MEDATIRYRLFPFSFNLSFEADHGLALGRMDTLLIGFGENLEASISSGIHEIQVQMESVECS